MAVIIPFTDEFGDTYPESYWRISRENISKENRTAHLLFIGYISAEKKGRRLIATKEYLLTREAFDTFFSNEVLNQRGVNVFSQAYAYAKQCLDTPGPNGTLVSFFNGFTDA